MSSAYERWLVPTVFRPFAIDLAARVAARCPRRVLELAAGTGVLTRELLASPDAPSVTATDLNQAMVQVGRAYAADATWSAADAASLPFAAGGFDVVACQFGVMFFPDRAAAYREAARVLTGDGRFVFSAWAAIDEHDFAAAMMAGIERAFADVRRQDPARLHRPRARRRRRARRRARLRRHRESHPRGRRGVG
jgi:ubiquinone/menaquinone biosynthesis C-methylase UbiE